MSTLFPELPIGPIGFRYRPNFITAAEEDRLLAFVRQIVLHPFQFKGYEAIRKVASFGLDYNFDSRTLRRGAPIPAALDDIIMLVANELSCSRGDIAEVLVTEYPIGAAINWHRDAPPFQSIAGLSLVNPCMFRFRPHDESKRSRKSVLKVLVEPRSLYVMQGEARSEWQHSIGAMNAVRYSITFRTLVE